MVHELDDNDLRRMREILEQGWSEDTAHNKEKFRESKYRSCGQCYVTARAVNRVFGWEVLHLSSKKEDINHYWNRMPNGREVDFTSDQFEGDGIHTIQGWTGKPRTFKPIEECKTINQRLKRFLEIVEEPLRRLKQSLS
jgi:hypothetical protein